MTQAKSKSSRARAQPTPRRLAFAAAFGGPFAFAAVVALAALIDATAAEARGEDSGAVDAGLTGARADAGAKDARAANASPVDVRRADATASVSGRDVTATVLAGALWLAFSSPLMGAATWYRGAICAAWLWLGFVAMGSSPEVIWMNRSLKLWLFELSSSLVSLVAMGAILAVWR